MLIGWRESWIGKAWLKAGWNTRVLHTSCERIASTENVSAFRWKADCASGSAVIARCKPAPRRAEAVREALAQKEKEETRRRRWSSWQRRTALDALLLPALRTTFHLLLRETAAVWKQLLIQKHQDLSQRAMR